MTLIIAFISGNNSSLHTDFRKTRANKKKNEKSDMEDLIFKAYEEGISLYARYM